MCGIAGIVYREAERPVSEALVRRMCAALRHRGARASGSRRRARVEELCSREREAERKRA